MSWDTLLPPLVLLTSLGTGIIIFLLDEQQERLRTSFNLVGASLNLLLVGVMLWGVFEGRNFEVRWRLLPGLQMPLRCFLQPYRPVCGC